MNPTTLDMNVLYLILGVLVGYIIGSRIGKQAVAKGEERREAILALFAHKDHVSNEDVEQSLGVSSPTALRYLVELEKYGAISQVSHERGIVVYRRR